MAQDIEKKVDKYMNIYLKKGNFSGSVLIAKDGKILVKKGYGLADIENNITNNSKTIFRLASVSKQFTAMAIMELYEKELLDLNDTLTKYIPDYPHGNKITIHNLLTHTSGIQNFTDFSDYVERLAIPTTIEETIKRFKNKPLNFTPGDEFRYSNSNYILLAYIIEKVSGKTYEKFIKENIFKPLNMVNSGNDRSNLVLKNRAKGYYFIEGGPVDAWYIDMSIHIGGGSLYSTVEDLYLWDRALYTEKLVSKDSMAKIFTPYKGGYGYGWSIGENYGRKCISHRGGINGFSTIIERYVKDDVCVIVLSNMENAPTDTISRDLAFIAFGEETIVEDGPPEKEVNLALHKTASMSSFYEDGGSDPGKGLDGEKTGWILNVGFHTANEENPWWMVDMEDVHSISKIKLYNRNDGYCPERANTIEVMASEDGYEWNTVYSHNGTIWKRLTIPVNGIKARYVKVQLRERNYLHLNEVEVYGK